MGLIEYLDRQESLRLQRESLRLQRETLVHAKRSGSPKHVVRDYPVSKDRPLSAAEQRLEALSVFETTAAAHMRAEATDEEMRIAYLLLLDACGGREDLAALRSRKIWTKLLGEEKSEPRE